MGNLTPTARERQFLRAIAAPNQNNVRPGDQEWWSASNLRTTPLHADFRTATAMTLTGLGRSCERKDMAVSRRIGGRGHGWAEYRITSYGRGLVADSCIGGGLPWTYENSIVPRCPACRSSTADMGLPLALTAYPPAEVPAHPLPGYLPEATTPGERS